MTRKNMLLLLAAGAVPAALLFAQAPGSPAGTGFARLGAARMERLAGYLGLTQAQKDQLKPIIESARQQALPILAQLKQNHQATADLIKGGAGPQFDSQLQKLAAAQGVLVSQLVTLHGKTMVEVRALLTPEQRDKADQLAELFRPRLFGHR